MQTAKATILFAEDDSSLAFIVKDTLEDEGYKVVHCADGQTAIDSFDKTKFDICLLDIMMPNKDGYSVAKKLHSDTIEDFIIGNILFSFVNLKIVTHIETFNITQREADLLKFFCEHQN